MNPIKRAWLWLYPPKLQNKAGGLAFIRVPDGHDYGIETLNGRVVRTVQQSQPGFWEIDPKPSYEFTRTIFFTDGEVRRRGQRTEVLAFADKCLRPITPPGDEVSDKEVSELYQPGPTVPSTKEKV